MDSFEQTHISTAVPPLPEAELSFRPVRLAIAGFYRQMNQHLVRNRQLNEWILLLCTDGLSNQMDDQEILFEVVHGQDRQKCCQRLLEIAKGRGAPDNVTTVLVLA